MPTFHKLLLINSPLDSLAFSLFSYIRLSVWLVLYQRDQCVADRKGEGRFKRASDPAVWEAGGSWRRSWKSGKQSSTFTYIPIHCSTADQEILQTSLELQWRKKKLKEDQSISNLRRKIMKIVWNQLIKCTNNWRKKHFFMK